MSQGLLKYLLIVIVIATIISAIIKSNSFTKFNTIHLDNVTDFRHLRVALVCRSYFGDEETLRNSLIRTYSMFVDPEIFPLTLVLDDESLQDHAMGNRISKEFNISIKYEKLPSRGVIPHVENPKFKADSFGYHRQQWSTFYFDRHFSDDIDIIGVLDSDSKFWSFLTHESILNSKGEIKVAAGPTDLYEFDSLALKMKHSFEVMLTNRMPVFYWKASFKKIRKYLINIWQKESFDEVFPIFAHPLYSQFNIMYGALYHLKSEGYEYCLPDILNSYKISVASNRDWSSIRTGCCLTYSINCRRRDNDFSRDILRYSKYSVAWEDNRNLAEEYHAVVHTYINSMNKSKLHKMKSFCTHSFN